MIAPPRLLVILLAALLFGCGGVSGPATAGSGRPVPLILVSIDGLRPDSVERGQMPTLLALARQGASGAMTPSFPSLTFPNHYTLVTGLVPDRHGVIGNTMEDPRRPGVKFRLKDRDQVTDPFWWNEAEPVWVTAQRHHVSSATFFWPGSEAAIRGVRPDRWMRFDPHLPASERVKGLLRWFSEENPPAFATLYFDDVDHAGHEAGPDSPDVTAAMKTVDQAIAQLVQGLKDQGVVANLIIVSDHGMASSPPENRVILGQLAPASSMKLVSGGAVALVVPQKGARRQVERALTGRRHDHMQCWLKNQIPAGFQFGRNQRVAPIVCLAELGWMIDLEPSTQADPPLGMHGYDPREPAMRAVFIGTGPAFRADARLPLFPNVDVYPLVMKLIGVPPQPNQGTLKPFQKALN